MRSRAPSSTRPVPVSAILLLACLAATTAQAATGPADVGVDVRCLSLQHREGAVAYRDCLADADGGATSVPDALSFDDRHAIERACGTTPDGDCVEAELAALERAPALDALDAADRHAILRQCDTGGGASGTAEPDGAVGYRRCLADALAALESVPEPDLGTLTLSERSALALRCAAEESTAAGYRRCRREASGTGAAAATVADAGEAVGEDVAITDGSVDELAVSPDDAEDAVVEEDAAVDDAPADETAAEDGAPDDTIADETAAENGAPDDTITDDTAAEDVATGNVAANEAGTGDAATGNAAAESAAANEAVADDAITDETAAGNAAAESAAANEAVTDDAITDDVAADETVADDAATADVVSDEAIVEDVATDETATEGATTDAVIVEDEATEEAIADDVATDDASEAGAPETDESGTTALAANERPTLPATAEPGAADERLVEGTDDGSVVDEPIALAPSATDEPGLDPATPSAETGDAPGIAAAEPVADDEANALDASGIAPPGPGQRVEDMRGRLLATIEGLDVTERTLLAAAVALPLLLLGFWAVGRGAGSRAAIGERGHDGSFRNAALVGRVAPSMRDDESRPRENARDFSDDDFLDGLDEIIDADDTPPDGLERDRAAFVALDDADSDASAHPDAWDDDAFPVEDDAGAMAATGAAAPDDVRPDFTPRSAFGKRLLDGDTPLERRYAIEFLIYWMAYGDERYEPEARAAILAGGDEDGAPHTLVKRHVLEEDTRAFADVVRWVQSRCGEPERVQIVDLLMALLIGEGAITPAQNTLLHFLADAFGLGAERLDHRYREAFEQPVPPLARVDLAAWWERVEPDRPLRWDAHAVSALDEHDQHRVRLGLPLDTEIDETAIVAAFRRAARRCQPHRFDALGERERALVERQFAKFEQARDSLLGVRVAEVDA